MTRRTAAVGLFGVSLALYAAAFVIPFAWGAGSDAVGNPASIALFGGPFAAVGLVISIRRPAHPIGWSFAAAGMFSAVQAAGSAYADAALRTGGPHLPGAVYAGNLTQWIFSPGVLFGYTLPFLWFPEGSLLSPRWRWAVRAAVAGTVATCAINIVDPDHLNNYASVANPLAVSFPGFAFLDVLGLAVYVIALFAAIVSSVLRYRRSRDIERLQMRWFMVGVVGTGVAFGVQMTLLALTGDVGFGVLLMTIMPVCAAIAILRYRLFDIDRVISRTVSYALVTAVVIAPYVALTVAAGRLAQGSSIAVAALTLVTLGVLRPVHRNVQARIDRRFNRRRYDAGRTIDAFAVRLRDEVDPDVVRDDLLAVTVRAVEPASLSLWVAS